MGAPILSIDPFHPQPRVIDRAVLALRAGKLVAYRYEGFWMPMDTLKEMQDLEALYQSGNPPWAVWRTPQ
jgi:glucose-1-phosphate cytidylyltransferase